MSRIGIDDSVKTRDRVLKERNLRRIKSEYAECERDKKERAQREKRELAEQIIVLEKIKFQKIGGGDGDEEKKDIQPIGGFSKRAVYCVK